MEDGNKIPKCQASSCRLNSVRFIYRLACSAQAHPITQTHLLQKKKTTAKSDPTRPSPARSNIYTPRARTHLKKKEKNHKNSPSVAQPSARRPPPRPDRSKLRLPLTQAGAKTPHQTPLKTQQTVAARRFDPPGEEPAPSRPAEASRGETLAMAASVDAAVAVAPPASSSAVDEAGGAVEQARTLIGALNLLSRNLPLPPDVLRAVSSIYHDGGAGDGEGEAEKEGDEEMAAADAAEEGCAEGADEVHAGGSSVCTAISPFCRVLPGLRVGFVPRCWGLLVTRFA